MSEPWPQDLGAILKRAKNEYPYGYNAANLILPVLVIDVSKNIRTSPVHKHLGPMEFQSFKDVFNDSKVAETLFFVDEFFVVTIKLLKDMKITCVLTVHINKDGSIVCAGVSPRPMPFQ